MYPWNNLISLLLWVLCLSLLCHLFLATILKEIGDDMPLMGAWSSISNKSQEAWTGQPYLVRLVRRALRLFKPHLQPHPIQSIPIIMRPKPKYKMKILHLHFECVWIVCRCACVCVCGERLFMSVERSKRCATLWTGKEDTVRILNFIMCTPPINHKQTLLVWLFVTLEMFKLCVLIS